MVTATIIILKVYKGESDSHANMLTREPFFAQADSDSTMLIVLD